jgi:hypothetical protein
VSSFIASQPPMFAKAVLFRAHRHPVGERRDVVDDVNNGPAGLSLLALVDEPGVLSESARVKEKRNAVPIAYGPNRAEVAQRDRLPTARVVGDRREHDRDIRRPLGEEPLERVDVHVALERMNRRRLATLGDDQVERLRPGRLDIRSGRVEVSVVRNDLARPAEDTEEDLLRGPTLVGGDDVLERKECLNAF